MSSTGDRLRGAAPGEAAAVLAHDGVQRVDREIHLRQHFHGVGGAGRRGDGAAGGLGDQHAVRGDDRHHQHRGAVARDAADAVLVDDQRLIPVEPLAGFAPWRGSGYSTSSRSRSALPGGDQERRHLGLGVAVVGDVADDGLEVVLGEPLAVDLAPHRIHRGRWFGVRHMSPAHPSRRPSCANACSDRPSWSAPRLPRRRRH